MDTPVIDDNRVMTKEFNFEEQEDEKVKDTFIKAKLNNLLKETRSKF